MLIRPRPQHKLTMNREGKINTLYFAYGSNLNMHQMIHRCPGSKPISQAVLKDYKLTFRRSGRGYGVANVEAEKGHEVIGALYRVTRSDLSTLDRCEGHPYVYYRQDVMVMLPDGTETKVFAYLMHLDRYEPAMPSRSYYDTIEEGYEHWEMDSEELKDAAIEWIDSEGLRQEKKIKIREFIENMEKTKCVDGTGFYGDDTFAGSDEYYYLHEHLITIGENMYRMDFKSEDGGVITLDVRIVNDNDNDILEVLMVHC